MKKALSLIITTVFLVACSSEPEATKAEINMANMMGITVEELRNQTPEEHMQLMQNMMQENSQHTK